MSKKFLTKRQILQLKRIEFKRLMDDIEDFADTSDHKDFTFGQDVEESVERIKDELNYIHEICKDIWKKA
jgi:hypothetical protein